MNEEGLANQGLGETLHHSWGIPEGKHQSSRHGQRFPWPSSSPPRLMGEETELQRGEGTFQGPTVRTCRAKFRPGLLDSRQAQGPDLLGRTHILV